MLLLFLPAQCENVNDLLNLIRTKQAKSVIEAEKGEWDDSTKLWSEVWQRRFLRDEAKMIRDMGRLIFAELSYGHLSI